MSELKCLSDLLTVTFRDAVLLLICVLITNYLTIRAARNAMIGALRGIFADLVTRVQALETKALSRDFLVKWKEDLMKELDNRFASARVCFFNHATPEQIAEVFQTQKKREEGNI